MFNKAKCKRLMQNCITSPPQRYTKKKERAKKLLLLLSLILGKLIFPYPKSFFP